MVRGEAKRGGGWCSTLSRSSSSFPPLPPLSLPRPPPLPLLPPLPPPRLPLPLLRTDARRLGDWTGAAAGTSLQARTRRFRRVPERLKTLRKLRVLTCAVSYVRLALCHLMPPSSSLYPSGLSLLFLVECSGPRGHQVRLAETEGKGEAKGVVQWTGRKGGCGKLWS